MADCRRNGRLLGHFKFCLGYGAKDLHISCFCASVLFSLKESMLLWQCRFAVNSTGGLT